MNLNLIRTCDGNIINFDNVFSIEYHENCDVTYAHIDCGDSCLRIAHGNVLALLWNGRRDFTEVNYGA